MLGICIFRAFSYRQQPHIQSLVNMSVSIVPSGPPRKRGSASNVYRQISRRAQTSFSFLNRKPPKWQCLGTEDEEFAYKRRRVNVTALDLDVDSPLTGLYTELRELEDRLDEDLTEERKRVQEMLTQTPARLKGCLRVHIYNTHTTTQGEEVSWKLRIQGRLVHPNFLTLYNKEKLEPGYVKKFNWFFKCIQVRLLTGEVVEWKKQTYKRESDGLEINRKGGTEGELQLLFYLDSNPAKFKLSPTLQSFIGVKEETKENIVATIWEYVKKYNLQDTDEPRFINNDNVLLGLFGEARTDIAQLLQKVTAHLSEPDPIIITHKLRLSGDWTETEHVYDFNVEVEDPFQLELATYLGESQSIIFAHNSFANLIAALKAQRGIEIPANPIEQPVREIDQKIASLLADVKKHALRRDQAAQFIENPSSFVKSLVSVQNQHIHLLHSISKGEELSQDPSQDEESAAFYQQPWVRDLVERYLEVTES